MEVRAVVWEIALLYHRRGGEKLREKRGLSRAVVFLSCVFLSCGLWIP
jgi:hypothetical protein